MATDILVCVLAGNTPRATKPRHTPLSVNILSSALVCDTHIRAALHWLPQEHARECMERMRSQLADFMACTRYNGSDLDLIPILSSCRCGAGMVAEWVDISDVVETYSTAGLVPEWQLVWVMKRHRLLGERGWAKFERVITPDGEPSRCFVKFSLDKMMADRRRIMLEAPELGVVVFTAYEFRVFGSAICYAITWDFWGHNDMRVHLLPASWLSGASFQTKAVQRDRAQMPCKGQSIVSLTTTGQGLLEYFNATGHQYASLWHTKVLPQKGCLLHSIDKQAGGMTGSRDWVHGHNCMLKAETRPSCAHDPDLDEFVGSCGTCGAVQQYYCLACGTLYCAACEDYCPDGTPIPGEVVDADGLGDAAMGDTPRLFAGTSNGRIFAAHRAVGTGRDRVCGNLIFTLASQMAVCEFAAALREAMAELHRHSPPPKDNAMRMPVFARDGDFYKEGFYLLPKQARGSAHEHVTSEEHALRCGKGDEEHAIKSGKGDEEHAAKISKGIADCAKAAGKTLTRSLTLTLTLTLTRSLTLTLTLTLTQAR